MASPDSTCENCGALFPYEPEVRRCASCEVPVEGWTWRSDGLPGLEVLEVIGTGGMASVHRGRQESLQRDVAVKIVQPNVWRGENPERFLREVRILAQLDHPNIVPVYDSGTDSAGRFFYTMKMVRGRTLTAIIQAVCSDAETWTLERLIAIFRKVCDAVAFAHSRGILHRDLKPDNIMVGEFGEVLVMDWGLARGIQPTPASADSHADAAVESPRVPADGSLTHHGTVVGTPHSMSPEQAEGRSDLDARSDVYSLGGILYWILTLHPAVRMGTIDEMLDRVREGRIGPFQPEPVLTGSLAPRWPVPPALGAVVRKAMALKRDDRFSTVTAFAADVDSYLAGFATSAERIGPAGQLWLLIKRHRAVSVAALVLLGVSAGFVVQLISSERRATLSADIARHNEIAARAAEALAHEKAEAASRSDGYTHIALADSAYASNDSRKMRGALDAVPVNLRTDPNWQYLHTRTSQWKALIEWDHKGLLIGSTPHPSRPGVFTAAVGASSGERIITFDGASGKVLGEFPHRGGWVRGVAYSPDGRLLALGRIMKEGISIHDAETGVELRHMPTNWVNSLVFLTDGKRLLQSQDFGCALWDADTGSEIWKSGNGAAHVLLPDGQRIASVSAKSIALLAVEDGRELVKYPISENSPITASVSPDGTLLLVSLLNGQIRGVRLADGSTAFEVPAVNVGSVIRTKFTRDGQHFVVIAALYDSTQSVQYRDTATGSVLRELHGGFGGVESAVIHPLSGEMLIAGSRSATWELPQPRPPRWRLESSASLTQGASGFLGGDDLFLSADGTGEAVATDLELGEPRWKPSIRALNSATSADGLIGVAQLKTPMKLGWDFTIFRSEGKTIRETGTAHFNADPAAIAINCDGSRFAISAGWAGTDTYRVATGESLPKPDETGLTSTYGLAWHGRDPARLIGVFTRDGRRGFPNSQEWLISWDTNTGQRTTEMRNETQMNCLATEPGGTRLAEAGDDKLVRIRDADTFAILKTFRAHDAPISAIAWNPKRALIATGSADRCVRLWNAETGAFIEEVHIGLREPAALYFSPSGRRLACVTSGEKTLIWELE